MITADVNGKARIVVLVPEESMTALDFEVVKDVVNPFGEREKELQGVVIYSRWFPQWRSLKTTLSQWRAIQRERRVPIPKVAIVTDSRLGSLVETLSRRFIAGKVSRFSFDRLAQAKQWVAA